MGPMDNKICAARTYCAGTGKSGQKVGDWCAFQPDTTQRFQGSALSPQRLPTPSACSAIFASQCEGRLQLTFLTLLIPFDCSMSTLPVSDFTLTGLSEQSEGTGSLGLTERCSETPGKDWAGKPTWKAHQTPAI